MNGSRRAILDAMLHGEATPAEKLKAAELLEAMDARDPNSADREFFADLDTLPDAVLDLELDAVLIVDVVRSAFAGEPVAGISAADEYPQTTHLVRQEVARLLREHERTLEAAFALRLAEATREATPEPDEDDDQHAAADAPSAPPKPPRADVIHMAEVLKRWDDSPPESVFRRPLRPPRIGR